MWQHSNISIKILKISQFKSILLGHCFKTPIVGIFQTTHNKLYQPKGSLYQLILIRTLWNILYLLFIRIWKRNKIFTWVCPIFQNCFWCHTNLSTNNVTWVEDSHKHWYTELFLKSAIKICLPWWNSYWNLSCTSNGGRHFQSLFQLILLRTLWDRFYLLFKKMNKEKE